MVIVTIAASYVCVSRYYFIFVLFFFFCFTFFNICGEYPCFLHVCVVQSVWSDSYSYGYIYIYIYRVCIDIWIVLIFSWSEVKVSVKCVMTVGYITCFFLLILHNIVVLCQFGISI